MSLHQDCLRVCASVSRYGTWYVCTCWKRCWTSMDITWTTTGTTWSLVGLMRPRRRFYSVVFFQSILFKVIVYHSHIGDIVICSLWLMM